MSALLILSLLGVVAVVGVGIAFVVALAKKGQERQAKAVQLDLGMDHGAPKEWAGAHTPEAKLHRRLVDVSKTLRTVSASLDEDVAGLELRVELEEHVRQTDQRLIKAATLPVGSREPAIAEIEVSVAAIEAAAADLAVRQTHSTASQDVRALEDLRGRIQGMTGEA
ncbi:hypothetical protein [Euzebya tangerina]|uniref:hypothetical protein n=1 Tax=Euzebya tangerina TaxID=591198 RepID=UPI000E318B14|nr:hypothetical protein [Euzebya tangerina]